jgi:ADP-ribose pyrophosphatase YjhB (NUDIX family)
MPKRLRRRATAVVSRDGRVLLVRHRWQRRFSLPGGGVRFGESVEDAAARELLIELRLTVEKVTRRPDCDCDGSANRHHVCLVEASGEPVRRRIEVAEFRWWDGREPVRVFPHVRAVMGRISEA